MPAALVPLILLSAMVPLTLPWSGRCASPIAPCTIWNSLIPPVSSGSDWPSGRFSPTFSNTLSWIEMFVMFAVPTF